MMKEAKSEALRKKAMEDTDSRCKHCGSKKHKSEKCSEKPSKKESNEEKVEREVEKEEEEE